MFSRVRTLALVAAAGLSVSSCSVIGGLGFGGNEDKEAAEPEFTAAATTSAETSTPATSTPATSSASSSSSSSSSSGACVGRMELKDTDLGPILERKESAITGMREKFVNISVTDDDYDPCAILSYVVLGGEVAGHSAKVPVFFKQGELLDDTNLFLTTDSLTVTKDGTGYTYESEQDEYFTGVEGSLSRPGGSGRTEADQKFTASQDKVYTLDLSAQPSESASELGAGEVDMRGEESFMILAGNLEVSCVISEEENIACNREKGKMWRLEDGLDSGDTEFNVVRIKPGERKVEFGQLPKESGTAGARPLKAGLYRVGKGNLEAQVFVKEGVVMINAPHTHRVIMTEEYITLADQNGGGSSAGVDSA